MGVVREAEDVVTGRTVAIKTISIGTGTVREALGRRLARELSTISRIRSPYVVEVLGHGLTGDGSPYYVMERLEGCDLSRVLEARGSLAPQIVVRLVGHLARALEAAHEASIVHRDVKPSNIFLARGADGITVKLLDFGVAKDTTPLEHEPTTTGTAVGTPYYMSPEQIVATRTIDGRSDIWSLGVVAFRAITGVLPFQGQSLGALAVAMHSSAPPKATAHRPELPIAVDAWFAKACARTPAARFGSALEAARALEEALELEGTNDGRAFALTLPEPAPELEQRSPFASTNAAPHSVGSPVSPLAGSVSAAPVHRSLASAELAQTAPSKRKRHLSVGATFLLAVFVIGAFVVVRRSISVDATASAQPRLTEATFDPRGAPISPGAGAAIELPPVVPAPIPAPSALPSATRVVFPLKATSAPRDAGVAVSAAAHGTAIVAPVPSTPAPTRVEATDEFR